MAAQVASPAAVVTDAPPRGKRAATGSKTPAAKSARADAPPVATDATAAAPTTKAPASKVAPAAGTDATTVSPTRRAPTGARAAAAAAREAASLADRRAKYLEMTPEQLLDADPADEANPIYDSNPHWFTRACRPENLALYGLVKTESNNSQLEGGWALTLKSDQKTRFRCVTAPGAAVFVALHGMGELAQGTDNTNRKYMLSIDSDAPPAWVERNIALKLTQMAGDIAMDRLRAHVFELMWREPSIKPGIKAELRKDVPRLKAAFASSDRTAPEVMALVNEQLRATFYGRIQYYGNVSRDEAAAEGAMPPADDAASADIAADAVPEPSKTRKKQYATDDDVVRYRFKSHPLAVRDKKNRPAAAQTQAAAAAPKVRAFGASDLDDKQRAVQHMLYSETRDSRRIVETSDEDHLKIYEELCAGNNSPYLHKLVDVRWASDGSDMRRSLKNPNNILARLVEVGDLVRVEFGVWAWALKGAFGFQLQLNRVLFDRKGDPDLARSQTAANVRPLDGLTERFDVNERQRSLLPPPPPVPGASADRQHPGAALQQQQPPQQQQQQAKTVVDATKSAASTRAATALVNDDDNAAAEAIANEMYEV